MAQHVTILNLILALFLATTASASFDENLLKRSTSTELVATTITVTTPATTTPESASYTNPATFESSILNSTNFYRYEHDAPFVSWNTSLATYAANWAAKCVWKHSHGPNGENLAEGYPDATSAVDAWGNERAQYNFKTPTGFSEATGHFTQLVWKGSRSVGCAAVNCADKGLDGVFVVCEYWPAGNIVGDNNQYFVQNVNGQVNDGKGYDEAQGAAGVTGASGTSSTATATATALGTGVSSSATASPTGEGMGDASSYRSVRTGWWALGATVAALVLAGGMS